MTKTDERVGFVLTPNARLAGVESPDLKEPHGVSTLSLIYDVRRSGVRELEEAGMEPLLREVLLGEPEIVAWLKPHDLEDGDDDEPARAS